MSVFYVFVFFIEPSTDNAPFRPTAAPPDPTRQPAANPTALDQLERLAALRAAGAIDEVEFVLLKSRVLSGAGEGI